MLYVYIIIIKKIDNKNIQRPSAITLYVFFGIILFLWFYTIYSVKSLYWIYLQYLPPHFIVFYALGTVFISVYEAARTFTSDSANCLVVLIVGAFGHTLHASSAYSTATYMYYEKMKILKIKNNWLYLALRVFVIMALEFMYNINYIYYLIVFLVLHIIIIMVLVEMLIY